MDTEYRAYFRQRSLELLTDQPVRRASITLGYQENSPAHFVASAAVETARGALPQGVGLRPDAEVVLYVLALELVARPVLALQPNVGPELAADVGADAATVTRAAVSGLQREAELEVTAHGVIDGLSQSWQELRTARWRVWDRHRE